KREYRSNTLDPATKTVTISDRRAQAIEKVAVYFDKLYGNDPELRGSRESFAMKEDTLPSASRRVDLAKVNFWTAWDAATERPGTEVTYTNNCPREPHIDNEPSTNNVIWSVVSVVLLLAGIAFLVWGWAFLHRDEPEPQAPKHATLTLAGPTPPQ